MTIPRLRLFCAALLLTFATSPFTLTTAARDGWSPTGSMAVPREGVTFDG